MAWTLRFHGVGNSGAVELGSAMATIERDGRPWLTIDCGGEGLTQCVAHYGAMPEALFVTHTHLDHVAGFERLFGANYFATPRRDGTRLYVPAPLVPLLQQRVAGYPNVVAEGGANFWDAFRLVPVGNHFWHEGVRLGIVLEGRRLGVIGLGRLGSRIAAYGKVFGMEVVAWSQNLTRERAEECGARYVSKEELLATSDFVSVHVVLSDRTRGLIGAADLARMKPSAILVNTSRGPIVDEAALIEAIKSRKIAHAALDVYAREPLPVDHPLRSLENVTLAPHLGYVNTDVFGHFYGESVKNIEAWLDGKPINVLNPDALK